MYSLNIENEINIFKFITVLHLCYNNTNLITVIGVYMYHGLWNAFAFYSNLF